MVLTFVSHLGPNVSSLGRHEPWGRNVVKAGHRNYLYRIDQSILCEYNYNLSDRAVVLLEWWTHLQNNLRKEKKPIKEDMNYVKGQEDFKKKNQEKTRHKYRRIVPQV